MRQHVTDISRRLVSILMLALLFSMNAKAAELTASVDRTQVALGESLTLSLRLDSQIFSGRPDFSMLIPYFEIVANTQSRQMRSVNGKSESWTQWNLTLMPKTAGTILIPPFAFAGARSDAITLEVSERPAGAAVQSDYFVEMDIDKSRVYRQEQVLVTLRLVSAVTLSELTLAPLTVEGARVERLDERQYARQHNGRRFMVYELIYALFPKQSGVLEIPSQHFMAVKNAPRSLFDRFNGERVRLSSEPRQIEVLPPDSAFNAADWLPASRLTLSQTFSEPAGGYQVGVPVTRTITLKADGVEAATVAPLNPGSISGVKVYPEPAQNDEQKSAHGLSLQRTERFGLVPTQPGTLTVPAFTLRWWDTSSNQVRTAELPARTFQVQAAAGVAVSAAADTRTAVAPALSSPAEPVDVKEVGDTHGKSLSGWSELSGSQLLWTQLLWAVVCALFAALWWRERRRRIVAEQPSPALHRTGGSGQNQESLAFKSLQQVCLTDDQTEIRQALLAWLKAMLPASARPALGDLSPWVTDPVLIALARQLDARLYAAEAEAQTEGFAAKLLLEAVARERKKHPAGAGSQAGELPPLYAA